MVIKGLALAELTSGKPENLQRRHIVCSAIEHDSIINPCKQLQKLGFTITYVAPRKDGVIRLSDIKRVVTRDTLLVCVMAVNNELGTVNNIEKITNFTKRRKIYSLVDCTQLVGYGGNSLRLGLNYPNASFFSFSAHKIYGPTGVGCLVATENNLDALTNNGLIIGGAQEKGLRGGTTNVAGVVGMGTAVKLVYGCENYIAQYYEMLYIHLIQGLKKAFGNKYKLNVIPSHRNIISINFEKYFRDCEEPIDSLAAELALRDIAVSAGSACDSQHNEAEGDFNPSHVLAALGLNEQEIRHTIRVSFNVNTKVKDIDKMIQAILTIGKAKGVKE
jgi:cysteine desulfurase